MSGFAGLLHLDGAPVDPARLARMAEALVYRSPDGMRTWISGSVGMVHGRLWTTPEEVGEEQPIADPAGKVWLAADARVDNREDLLMRLGGRVPALAADVSDARLLLAAYRVFGADSCAEVIGDFAFALWDGERRRLLLARDAMGIRQLYYTVRGRTILFASTIGALLAALPERPPLNRNLIEAFLQESYRHWIRHTVYQGILRLPPGHHLDVASGGPRLRRWWRMGATFAGSFETEEQWVEGFREAFELAVRCRLRSSTPVGLIAGGGVDSAAMACSAYAQLGSEAASSLRLISLIFPATPTADETDYLDELVRWLDRIPVRRIAADALPASLRRRPGDDHPLDEPELYLLRSHTSALFASAARDGCRVVLAGEGANQVLGHSFYFDPAGLRLVGWRELFSELRHFRAASGMGTPQLMAHAYLWPIVPAPLQEWLRRTLRGAGNPWVQPAGRGSWRRRLPPLPPRRDVESLPRLGRWAARSVGRPFDLARYSAVEVTAAHSNVEWRLPFLDRRVVDLLIHLPRRLRSWRGSERRVLRLAMRGRMPERIRRRRTKSHVQDVLDRVLRYDQRDDVERLLDNSRAQAVDFINEFVTGALGSYLSGRRDYALLPYLSLETWLREHGDEDGRTMSEPRVTPPDSQPPPAEEGRDRVYQPPRLEEYGSLKDLTQTGSNVTAGDGFAGSYAT